MLKCVPLNIAWTGSETKLDLKAIYRRRKEDNWGQPILDKHGNEQFDTTGPLPLRRHAQWQAKGFVYITLADFESLEKVIPELGPDWREYIQDKRTRSPFSADLYLQGLAEELKADLAELKTLIEEFGPEAVTAIKQKDNPKFVIPKSLAKVKQLQKQGTEA